MVQEQIPITLVSSVDAALPADNLITTQRPTRKLQDLQTNVIQHNLVLLVVVQLQSKLYLDKNKSGAGILLLLSDYVLTQFTMGMIYFFSPLSLNPLTILSQKTSHFKEHNLQTLCRFSGFGSFSLQISPTSPFFCFSFFAF